MNWQPVDGDNTRQQQKQPIITGKMYCIIGFCIGIFVDSLIAFYLFQFDKLVNQLPSGAAVRTMGLSFTLGVLWTFALAFGLPISTAGIVLCWRKKQQAFVILGILSVFLNILAQPISLYGTTYILGARGLLEKP